jgi:hypothetical protein
MSFQDLLGRLLTEPTPADLLALQTTLLAAEANPERADAARSALNLVREFHGYLSELEAKSSAREYSGGGRGLGESDRSGRGVDAANAAGRAE